MPRRAPYLYIITWDDLGVTQGVLGQFYRNGGCPFIPETPRFQVCATGLNYSSDFAIAHELAANPPTLPPNPGNAETGPTLDVINAQIANCDIGG